MNLTSEEIAMIKNYSAAREHISALLNALEDEYGPQLDELINRHSLELDEELEDLLPASYWQFEVRCRIYALKKLKDRQQEEAT